MLKKETENGLEICFQNGTRLEFIYDTYRVKGIGKVFFKDKQLRSDEECIIPEIATPDGIEVDYYEFLEAYEKDHSLIIVTKPYFKVSHRMEWTEHALHQRISTASWSNGSTSPENAILEWIIKPEQKMLDGIVYEGFSYSFHYNCDEHSIYQIEDKATWELGGNACGNIFVMRNAFTSPVVKFEKETHFYTGWELPNIANPHVFQHLPLYAQMQGFTFQFDNEDILITSHDKPSHIRALFQKESGDNKLLHFNQFCFDLTNNVTTVPRRIIAAQRKEKTETGVMNHYLRVRDTLQEEIRKYYHLKFYRVRPSAHVETWQIANVSQFEPIFEQLHEWSIQETYLMPLWRSAETDINPRFAHDKDDFGIFGNMCCPLELEIADCYGGWDGLKKILEPAVKLGIDNCMWFGSHFSSLSHLPNIIKDIFAKDVCGQNQRNNYGHVLHAVNQNSKEYIEYFINAFKKAKECGLSGIFRDSHFNMAVDTINYLHIDYDNEEVGTSADQVGFVQQKKSKQKDMILSMHDTEAYIQSGFQNELDMIYYVESIGMMGTPMCGSNHDFVRGYEYIFSDMQTGMNFHKVKEYGEDVNLVYFKGLSVRLIYPFSIEVNAFPKEGSIDEWWNPEMMVPMIKAFHKVAPYMEEMVVLEDGNGILWKSDNADVVFAYKDFSFSFDGKKEIIETIHNTRHVETNIFDMKNMMIYVLKESIPHNE